jgi:hypothetical protein
MPFRNAVPREVAILAPRALPSVFHPHRSPMQRREMLHLLGAAAIPALALAPGEVHAVGTAVAQRVARALPTGFFTAAQFRTIDQLAEHILPRTDTPGAHDAGVARFIEVIVAEWDTEADRTAFLRGIAEVDARSRTVGGRPFVELDAAEQHVVLSALDAEARIAPAAPAPFFRRLTSLTLFGYYNSKVGVRQERQQVFMPGRFDGDAPFPSLPEGR